MLWNHGSSNARQKMRAKRTKYGALVAPKYRYAFLWPCVFANSGMRFIHTSITRATSTCHFGFFSVIHRPLSRQNSDTKQGEQWVDHQVALASNSDTLHTPTPNMLQNTMIATCLVATCLVAISILLDAFIFHRSQWERLIHCKYVLSLCLYQGRYDCSAQFIMSACFRVQRALTPLNWLTGTMTKSILLHECCGRHKNIRLRLYYKNRLVFLVFSLLLPPNWRLALNAGWAGSGRGGVLASLTHTSDTLQREWYALSPLTYIGHVEGDSAGPDAYISGAQRRVVAK
jgi:hypothetical protein